MNLAQRVTNLHASSTLAVAATAQRLQAGGVDVIGFGAGEPDLDTPPSIRQAAKKAIDSGHTHYRPVAGPLPARDAVANKLINDNGLAHLMPDNIVISAGGKHAFYLVTHSLFDANSQLELLLPTPSWVSYRPIAELAGARIVEVPTTPEGQFKMTPDGLRAVLTPQSRLLVINSPANPTGALYSPDELKALADVVTEHNASGGQLMVVSDDIYEKLVYDDVPFATIGQFLDPEYSITINGLSKAFAMTGWRIGYTAAPLELAQAITRLQGQMITCIPAFCFPAMIEALTNCSDDVAAMRDEFRSRRDLMTRLMDEIPDLDPPPSHGAFYLFPSVKPFYGTRTESGHRIESADDFVTHLLEQAHVAVVPGREFGGCGVDHIRFSYACSPDLITRGLERVDAFVRTLRH